MIRPNGDTSLFADQLDNPRFLAIRPAAVPEPSSWRCLPQAWCRSSPTAESILAFPEYRSNLVRSLYQRFLRRPPRPG